MDKMKLNLEANPKRMELFGMALNAWKQEHVQRKIKEMFLIAISELEFWKLATKWKELRKEIVRDVDQDLAFVIKQTGQRIYEWIIRMRARCCWIANPEEYDGKKTYFGINYDEFINYCLDEIHWTELGLVDELKTISLVWLNKPDISDFQKFCLACFTCDKSLIDLFWEKLPNDVKDSDHSRYLKNPRTYIIAYWIGHKKSTLQTFINDVNLAQDVHRFDETKSVEENILTCSSKRYNRSYLEVQYLMKKLSYETVQKNISIWFKNYCYVGPGYMCQLVPILLFLYNEMSEDARQTTFTAQDEFLMSCDSRSTAVKFLELLAWYPFQELLAPGLSQLQPYLKNSDYTSIFDSVLQDRFSIKKNVRKLRQLPHLWEVVPAGVKERIANVLLPDIFIRWDIPNMKLIVNDMDLREKRETLLKIGYKKFMELVWENKFDMINPFVDEILVCEDWEDDVREKVKKIYQILMIDLDVKSAEEYLNSQFAGSDSYFSLITSYLSTFIYPEEEKSFMKKINHEILFYYFFGKQKMELIREYFEKIYPDDLKTFKESIKNNPFTVEVIYETWIQWKDFEHGSPENFCNEFLLWLLNFSSNDVLAYRKNVLLKDLKNKINELFLKSKSNRFDIVPDLLMSWCFCTAKDIKKIKSELLSGAVPSKFAELIEKDDIVTSKKLLDWTFRSEKIKRKFKSRFIISKNAIYALMSLIGTMKSEETDPNLKTEDISRKFKDYINFWMESFEDMTIVQRSLMKYRVFEETEEKWNKIEFHIEADSTTFEKTEAEFPEDDDLLLHYLRFHSINYDELAFENFCRGKENSDLFLKLLDESIKVY